MATNPFRQLDVIRNVSLQGRKVTDCYRLMYNKELWKKAYAKLYWKTENLTEATSKEMIDEFSLQKMNEIINQLKAGAFRFTPVRKGYISNFRDKLIQEVMRMILDNIYEPVFSDHSHGFRKKRSAHTALSQIKNTWKGLTWCIEGDIKDFFDTINYEILIKIIAKKIEDRRFLLLIHNALIGGVMEGWQFNKTYSGVPKGGILSPLLVNIYLHEFDLFIEKQLENVDSGKLWTKTKALSANIFTVRSKTQKTGDKLGHKLWDQHSTQIKQMRYLKKKSFTIPSTDSIDENNRRMEYLRYADHFVIGIAGNKEDAMKIKELIGKFLEKELALELSEKKTLVTHLEKPVPFLGYEFRTWEEEKVKRVNYKNLEQAIKLEVPSKKIKEFALKYNYGNLDDFKITHRTKLINNSELEIVMTYNAELRGIANYYKLANNYHHLDKLFYLAESSFIKTIANKRRSTSAKVAKSMKKHQQGTLSLVHYDKTGNKTLHQFVRLKDLPKPKGTIKADWTELDVFPIHSPHIQATKSL